MTKQINRIIRSKKKRNQEKKKIEQFQAHNLKRKNNAADQSSSRKKKEETIEVPRPTKAKCPRKQAERKQIIAQKQESLNRSVNRSLSLDRQSPLPKNLANTRLSTLRTRLSSEAQQEDLEKSSLKRSHDGAQSVQETPQKLARTDQRSQTATETKSTISQSPSSDSLQSMPSPSQFFAANKIISSMKAQLPEQYCNEVKPKDAFADIEQGISNQTAEYPQIKHPATPPQFYQASKLVSAIKSKLSYKLSKETSVQEFSTAKERMEVLRARLSEGVDSSTEGDRTKEKNTYIVEAMDVDFKESNEDVKLILNCSSTKEKSSYDETLVLVVDTNIFIHELDVIKNVLNSHLKGYSEQPTLLVPWRVINELDRLKDNNNGNGAICKRAKSAMDYLYKSLPENRRIRGQSLRDANSHIYPCELPDDEILNCCLQQAERGKSVILITNDKNLCNKALINDIKCIGLSDLKKLLESHPQPTVDPDLYAGVKHYETTLHKLLSNILENEMRAKYNNLWQHVLFKAPPWKLLDVLECLLKHWIAVFHDVFPRIEHLITDLKNSLASIERKNPKALSRSEVGSFKELCVEVAKKCQIIPEYLDLAKATVERLSRQCDKGKEKEMEKDKEKDNHSQVQVIDAFEALWTVFSGYCAKLATSLGVAHNLEDNLPGGDPLDVLMNKLPQFSTQIINLTIALQGVLPEESSEQSLDTHIIIRLESALKDSLTTLCMDTSAVTVNNLRIFCTKCRNMLKEAYAKFSQLAELLQVCRNNLSN